MPILHGQRLTQRERGAPGLIEASRFLVHSCDFEIRARKRLTKTNFFKIDCSLDVLRAGAKPSESDQGLKGFGSSQI